MKEYAVIGVIVDKETKVVTTRNTNVFRYKIVGYKVISVKTGHILDIEKDRLDYYEDILLNNGYYVRDYSFVDYNYRENKTRLSCHYSGDCKYAVYDTTANLLVLEHRYKVLINDYSGFKLIYDYKNKTLEVSFKIVKSISILLSTCKPYDIDDVYGANYVKEMINIKSLYGIQITEDCLVEYGKLCILDKPFIKGKLNESILIPSNCTNLILNAYSNISNISIIIPPILERLKIYGSFRHNKLTVYLSNKLSDRSKFFILKELGKAEVKDIKYY
jgi:hypothetical protein